MASLNNTSQTIILPSNGDISEIACGRDAVLVIYRCNNSDLDAVYCYNFSVYKNGTATINARGTNQLGFLHYSVGTRIMPNSISGRILWLDSNGEIDNAYISGLHHLINNKHGRVSFLWLSIFRGYSVLHALNQDIDAILACLPKESTFRDKAETIKLYPITQEFSWTSRMLRWARGYSISMAMIQKPTAKL